MYNYNIATSGMYRVKIIELFTVHITDNPSFFFLQDLAFFRSIHSSVAPLKPFYS
jgi:hypothetical protein